MNGSMFREILEKNLQKSTTSLGHGWNFVLRHDNDSRHTANFTMEWFENNGIRRSWASVCSLSWKCFTLVYSKYSYRIRRIVSVTAFSYPQSLESGECGKHVIYIYIYIYIYIVCVYIYIYIYIVCVCVYIYIYILIEYIIYILIFN